MVYPAIEVTVVTVGNRTIEDETTEDGQKYQKAFHAAATTIPGCSRGCWGRSDKYPDKVIHFIGTFSILKGNERHELESHLIIHNHITRLRHAQTARCPQSPHQWTYTTDSSRRSK